MVLGLAEEMDRRAEPGAWLVDFTNPTGIVTQALLDEGHHAIGLCNVAIALQRNLAERFAVPPESVQLDHVGLNHLSWERAVVVDGVDRLPEILADPRPSRGPRAFPAELVRAIGAIPSYYLRYYYLARSVLEHQRTDRTRAEEVMEIEAELLAMYETRPWTRNRSSSPAAAARSTPTRRPR